jgi:23S rRNA maturation-related 3'-5' exoribonuclease YhaM
MTEHGHGHERLIAELRAAIEKSPGGERRERLLALLHRLEQSHGTESFGHHVKALIEEAEVDAAEVAPFLSRLSALLP